jgi:PAS domain S-box-containing protein
MAADGRYLSANPALATMFGFPSPNHLMAAAHNPMFATVEGREQFLLGMERDGAVRDFVTEARCSDGTALWVSQSTRAIRDNDGRIVHYEGMVVDITARKCAEERLIHQALHDPLTGLPNRSLFLHRLQQAIAGGRQGAGASFALLFIDCDRFKLVSATSRAIACSYCSGIGSRAACAAPTRSRGWGETSSRFSSRTPCPAEPVAPGLPASH